jgi:hypothetical protein
MHRTVAATLIVLSSLSMSCTTDAVTEPDILSFVKVAGDDQTGSPGGVAAIAPEVRVTLKGEPLAGVTILFEVGSGGGSVTGATILTDADGLAAVGSWTFGPTAGTNTLTATIQGQSPGNTADALTFTATTSAGQPAGFGAAAVDPKTRR